MGEQKKFLLFARSKQWVMQGNERGTLLGVVPQKFYQIRVLSDHQIIPSSSTPESRSPSNHAQVAHASQSSIRRLLPSQIHKLIKARHVLKVQAKWLLHLRRTQRPGSAQFKARCRRNVLLTAFHLIRSEPRPLASRNPHHRVWE